MPSAYQDPHESMNKTPSSTLPLIAGIEGTAEEQPPIIMASSFNFTHEDSFARGLHGTNHDIMRKDWVFRKEQWGGLSSDSNSSQQGNNLHRVQLGMPVPSQEVWSNYLLGKFLVIREEVGGEGAVLGHSTSTVATNLPQIGSDYAASKSPPQQRLVIQKIEPHTLEDIGNRHNTLNLTAIGGPTAQTMASSKSLTSHSIDDTFKSLAITIYPPQPPPNPTDESTTPVQESTRTLPFASSSSTEQYQPSGLPPPPPHMVPHPLGYDPLHLAVTIHKHSKFAAFSLSRHFHSSWARGSEVDAPHGFTHRAKTDIMLAQESVQKRFSDTETTKSFMETALRMMFDMSNRAVGSTPSLNSTKRREKKERIEPRQFAAKDEREREKAGNVLSTVPRESPFMLLPLWPGETDPYSQRHFPFEMPLVPKDERMFLLVYYKVIPRDMMTDTTNQGTIFEPVQDNRNIILPCFHIIGRQVSYTELQGSGIQVSDQGLAVSGPLEEAYNTAPKREGQPSSTASTLSSLSLPPNPSSTGTPVREWLMGSCYSRDSGIEFDPRALIELGVCSFISEEDPVSYPLPPGVPEEEIERSIKVELTAIGNAVVEMMWVGGLALTSFEPVNETPKSES